MTLKLYFTFLFVFLSTFYVADAQDTLYNKTSNKSTTDTVSIVNQIHSDRLRFQKIDSVKQLEILAGHVYLMQDNTKFYCDSAVINKSLNVLEAFGNVHINDADSVHTYAQYLVYYIDKKLAVLKKKVSLTDGNGILTTEELQYDTRAKTGTYTNGGKIINKKTVITSKEATYYGDMKDVYFKKDVKMRDPQYKLDTDSLLYNTETQIATFITKTKIKDSAGANIVTSDGYYDMKNKIASFGKRSVINDGKATTVTGDNIHTDSSGRTIITGNGVYIDTVQKISLLANYIIADKKKNTVLATQHPLMIIEQDKDTLYVTADTLFSARMSDLKDTAYTDLRIDTLKKTKIIHTKKDTSDIRYFRAFHNVRIFSDSLQAVCDSLFYSATDSIFRLLQNPIVWASKSQLTGDTIYLFTKNKKAERIYVFENSMIINKSADNMYNQISGKTTNGYFKEGSIDYLRTKGSPAQSIYYAKDENDAMVGVNNASGDIIDMRFEDKELKKVVFIKDITGTMFPIQQLPEDKKELRNFRWLEEKRPKTKYELFENIVPIAAKKE